MTTDTTTYAGWIAAAQRLLSDRPDWTAIADGDHGFIVKIGDDIFAVANQGDGYAYSEDDLIELDQSAWGGEAWEDMTPERCRAVVEVPQFANLLHEGSYKPARILTAAQATTTTKTPILTSAQAAAVVALADAAERVDATVVLESENSHILVRVRKNYSIHLAQFFDGPGRDRTADFSDRAAFATAYGLN